LGTHPDDSAVIEPELDPAFDVLEPRRLAVPLVFNSPHSGTAYPARFLATSRLDPLALRQSEDTHVDTLFLAVSEVGAPLMRARFPRAYLDVNREPYELDPRMFDGRLPALANTRSMRVAGGLGTIPRLVGEGHEIYARRLPVAEAMRRIEAIYWPYHRGLQGLLARARRQFGLCVLVDCHSMPSRRAGGSQGNEADFVIGDRYGTSCTATIADTACYEIEKAGYTVSRNKPYAGGFITEHYGNPAACSHAIQIEINRSLYLNEQNLELAGGFEATRLLLMRVVRAIAEQAFEVVGSRRLAAE
jgi:N-formylglutamate amidohydrolase